IRLGVPVPIRHESIEEKPRSLVNAAQLELNGIPLLSALVGLQRLDIPCPLFRIRDRGGIHLSRAITQPTHAGQPYAEGRRSLLIPRGVDLSIQRGEQT